MNELKKMLKFGLVGISNTLVDSVAFALIILVLPINLVAKVISYCLGMLNSYLLNKVWTFKNKDVHNAIQVFKFIAVNLVALAIGIVVLNLCDNYVIDLLGNEYWGKIVTNFVIVTPFVLIINFIGNRFWVFRGNYENN